jgi:hypothetical protein
MGKSVKFSLSLREWVKICLRLIVFQWTLMIMIMLKAGVFEVLLCAKTVQSELYTNSSLMFIEIL